MDWFKWNKIIGVALGIVFFALIAWIVVGKKSSVPQTKPADAVASGSPAPAAADQVPDFALAIAKASAENGKTIAERCAACHDWAKGGPNKIGPNLYGVVGRARASELGFAYSPALKAKEGTWTYADLFAYLKQPAQFAPGNKMAFAGLPEAQDRLDLIAFLRLQADMPAPLASTP
jgi:cytochrome c